MLVKITTLSVIVILVIAFYNLAKKYHKSPWYASLGFLMFLVCFLISEFISNRLLGFLLRQGIIENSTNLSWNLSFLMVLIIGLSFCRMGYQLVEKKWKKEKIKISNPEILDDETIQ